MKKTRTAFISAGIVGFLIMLLVTLIGSASIIDDPIRTFFYGLRCGPLTSIAKGLSLIGEWDAVVALCIILLLIKPTRVKFGIPVSAGALFVTVFNKVIKMAVARPRPQDIEHLMQVGGYSFPSGHSITSMFVFSMLIYLVRANVRNKKTANILTAVLCVPMIGIGLSRIYLGVHYPTDVLAGWCLGFATMVALTEGIDIVNKRAATRKIS